MSEPCLLTKRAQRGTGAAAVDGVCSLCKKSVRWQPNDPSKGQPALVDIAAITKIQQAPGKPFVKLDTAAGPLVLGFESLTDRDDAVDLLKQFWQPPAGGGAAAGAAAAKGGSPGAGGSGGSGEKLLLPTATQAAALFRADKDLESVYKSLVVAGILSEAEFWRTRQAQLRDALAAGGGGGAARVRQRVGLPSAMLADVKPSADGQTEKVHFQLTPQIVRQIFTERPEVHRAYLAHVPGTMDEKAFWTRYFKQQYRRMAQRRKAGLVGAAADDDEDDELFAPFKKQLHEQEAQRAQHAVRRVDPTVNLAADAGERLSGGGFGSLRDAGSDPAAALRRANLDTIARDINRHAAVVLQGTPEGLADLDGSSSAGEGPAAKKGQDNETARIAQALAEQQKQAAAAAGSSAAASGSGGGGKDDNVSPERLAEWQERAASALEDLTLDDREKQYAPLNIQDPRAYFDATAAAGGAADGKPGAAKQDASAATAGLAAGGPAAALVAALAAVQPLALPDPPCDPAAASEVLLELSQGQDEALVAEFGPVAATALQYPPHDRTHGLPALLLEHLRGEALKTNELLRHLWGALPLVSAARADKAAKLARHLGEQRALLRSHMDAHPGTSQQVYVSMMLRPLAAAIDAALARYQQEQQARQRQQAAKAPP